jgi:hypothetical protein
MKSMQDVLNFYASPKVMKSRLKMIATCGCGLIDPEEEEYISSDVGYFCDEVCMVKAMDGKWISDDKVRIDDEVFSLSQLKKKWNARYVN